MESGTRPPSFAGQYYPENREDLISLLNNLRADARKPGNVAKGKIVGLIVPHEGYELSGRTAMTGYMTIAKTHFDNFVLIGPKHDPKFHETAVYQSGSWTTPLGSVRVNDRIGKAIVESDRNFTPDKSAHSGEHSLEVQIPFLQFTEEGPFEITPILMGNQHKSEAIRMARTLFDLGVNSPLIISADLNHYDRLNSTVRKDSLLIDAISSLDINRFYRIMDKEKISPCGYGPVAVLMEYSRLMDGQIDLIDYSTSYNYSGDMNKVVGYASMVSKV